jgi:hypothetical protein
MVPTCGVHIATEAGVTHEIKCGAVDAAGERTGHHIDSISLYERYVTFELLKSARSEIMCRPNGREMKSQRRRVADLCDLGDSSSEGYRKLRGRVNAAEPHPLGLGEYISD